MLGRRSEAETWLPLWFAVDDSGRVGSPACLSGQFGQQQGASAKSDSVEQTVCGRLLKVIQCGYCRKHTYGFRERERTVSLYVCIDDVADVAGILLVVMLECNGEVACSGNAIRFNHKRNVVALLRVLEALRHSVTCGLQAGVVNGLTPMYDAKLRVVSTV